MSEDIKAVLSREVQEFHASIISHSDTSYDVTRLCSNFTVFESITEHSLTGTMTIVDSNGLLHTGAASVTADSGGHRLARGRLDILSARCVFP